MTTQTPSCPVCFFKQPVPFSLKHPEASLYRCPECHHAFSDLRSIEKLEDYSPDYFEKTHKRWFENPNFSLFKKLGQLISEYRSNTSPSNTAVIDVGCGRGDFLRYLHQHFPKLSLTGIDLSPNQSIDGIHFEQGDFLQKPVTQTYDIVVSLVVIEHVLDIHTFVQKMSALTKPGGLVVIITNNDHSVIYTLSRFLAHCGFSKAFDRLYSKHHLNHFNVDSLSRLITHQGLNIKKVMHQAIPLAAVDIPTSSPIADFILRSSTAFLFFLGKIFQRNFLQAIIAQKS